MKVQHLALGSVHVYGKNELEFSGLKVVEFIVWPAQRKPQAAEDFPYPLPGEALRVKELVKDGSRLFAKVGAAVWKGGICHNVESDAIRCYQLAKQMLIPTRQSK